jgi:anthranilate synthase component 1
LSEVKKIMKKFKFVNLKSLPRFCGGLVGYISYDMVRFFENIPDQNPDDLKVPDCLLVLADNLLIFDHVDHSIKIINCVHIENHKKTTRLYEKAVRNIESIEGKLRQPLHYKILSRPAHKSKKIIFSSNFRKKRFEGIVKKAKQYIREGEFIQVVLSQRFKAKVGRMPPFDIYRNLRSLNPSPYMYFLDFKEVKLVGSSPEMLVRCEDKIIQTRPIAGTRPRGHNQAEDKRFEHSLLRDNKEKAEHLMLVDLGRNDIGKVSQAGKVSVSEFMSVERYSHVMHLVSEVKGYLKKNKDAYDVLRAAFPAGTVSGSPKVRAMEVIDELENMRRGPYAGCVGYFSFSGNLDTCITIRTIVIKDGYAYIQAGAGIVADSRPVREYNETVNKAKAMMVAISQECN